jgi:hypothetical protein
LVTGEAGTGTGEFAQALYEEMLEEFSCAIATYKGAIKSFFVAIATQLDIPTSIESDGDKPPKPMSVDALMFMDDYTGALAKNPKADIHFVGHSNGTYLLANALRNYATFKVNRVVFAGSVVRRDFPWDEYHNAGRVEKIRNDVATGDWVVGIFPRLLEILRDDVGSAGHNGFIDNIAQQNSYIGYFPGDHGAAIQDQYHPSIAHFILTGDNIQLELPEKQNGFVVLLSKLTILVWLIIISLIAGIGWLIFGNLGLIWLVAYFTFLIVLLYFI